MFTSISCRSSSFQRRVLDLVLLHARGRARGRHLDELEVSRQHLQMSATEITAAPEAVDEEPSQNGILDGISSSVGFTRIADASWNTAMFTHRSATRRRSSAR
jgi:hypothetical protein